jgi:hypothetical protein
VILSKIVKANYISTNYDVSMIKHFDQSCIELSLHCKIVLELHSQIWQKLLNKYDVATTHFGRNKLFQRDIRKREVAHKGVEQKINKWKLKNASSFGINYEITWALYLQSWVISIYPTSVLNRLVLFELFSP